MRHSVSASLSNNEARSGQRTSQLAFLGGGLMRIRGDQMIRIPVIRIPGALLLDKENSRVVRTRYLWFQRAVVGCSLLYALVFVAMLVFRPGSRHFYQAFNNIYQILPPLFAAACGI